MSKFKVGDKVKRVVGMDAFIARTGCECAIVTGVGSNGFISFNCNIATTWDADYFELINDWSIHNNTKVLRDLSDEQRGLLFNSWVKDKDCLEFYTGLMGDFEPTKNVIWDSTVIYRVRQKSERELFIEEWSSKIATDAYRNEAISQLVGEMFDAKLASYNKEKTNAN